jgi:hypothetical protein
MVSLSLKSWSGFALPNRAKVSQHEKLESTKSYGQHTVLRFTPCLFGLYTMVVLLYLQRPHP